MPDSDLTLEQKLWRHAEQLRRLNEAVDELLRFVKGGETNAGIRETLNEVKREVARVERIASRLEALEERAVSRSDFDKLILRIDALEKDRTLQQGAKIGTRALWGIVSGAILFFGVLITIALQMGTLLEKVQP